MVDRLIEGGRTPAGGADAAGAGAGGASQQRYLHVVQRRPLGFPAMLTGFIGRERELAEISGLLERSRLVTLTGSGGSGKTRLAIEVADRVLERFPDGAAWIELAPLGDGARVAQATAAALQLRSPAGGDFVEAVAAHLQPRRFLLVLDNCEHVVEACAALARTLLERAPELHILATSREPLHIAGEVTCRIPGLSLPAGAAAAESLPGGEAVELFLERAQAVSPRFALTDGNADDVVRICRRLEGIPLAIELAAARTQLLSPAQIAQRLDDAFRLLTLGSRDATPRQKTLRGAMDWSHDLLPPLERRLFPRLAAFAGGFTLEAAEAVCVGEGIGSEEVLDGLTHLVDRSLVVVTEAHGEARCRLLETVRQYAAEKLAQGTAGDAVADRHAAFFLGFVESSEPELMGPRQAAAMDRLEVEHDNLRAALRWLIGHGEAARAARLGGAIWRFWQTRGYLAEGRDWLRQVLALHPAADSAEGEERAWRAARPAALQGAGVLAWGQGEYDEARDLFTEALERFTELGEIEGIAALRNNLGVIALHRAEYERATELFESSLEIRRRQANQVGIATLLNNLGATAGKRGDLARARARYDEALTLQREIGHTQGAAISLSNLGATAFELGDMPGAERAFEEALSLRRQLADRSGVADSLGKLARVALRSGQRERAQALYANSLTLLQELGDKERIAAAMMGIAALAVGEGQADRAVRLLGAAEGARATIGAPLTAEERAEQERVAAAARERLDEPVFAALWAEGRATPLSGAIELAWAGLPAGTNAVREDIDAGAGDAAVDSATAAGSPGAAVQAIVARPPTPDGTAIPAAGVAPELRIRALGRSGVWRGEDPVPAAEWGSAKPRELLFYLLAHPEGRTKEQVGLALWPEASQAQLRNSFHVALHHLRRALGRPDWIVFADDRYRFDRALPYEYDVEQFETALQAADRLRRTPGAAASDLIACLEAALAHWHGDFLEETLFGDWHLPLQDALRRQRSDALLALGELRLEEGQLDPAATAFRELLGEDRLLERAHRGLMLALARQGHPDRALAHFRLAETLLRDELGAGPSAATQALADRLRAGEAI